VDNLEPVSLADGIASIFARQKAGEFSAAKVRAAVCQFGWENVASGIITEYGTVFKDATSQAVPKVSAQASCL
jgi:hypothetical protein